MVRNGHARVPTGTLGGEPIRIYAAPLPTIGGGRATGGAVIVASSTAQIDQTLHRLRALTLLAALAAAALAAPAALLATRRVLRPLAQLSADASVIGQTADPSRRLATTTSADEVARLADALNAMLAALEHARDGERRFLADASHELRTPLTALRGNAAYLAKHSPESAAFADLEADIARLGRLVDLLLGRGARGRRRSAHRARPARPAAGRHRHRAGRQRLGRGRPGRARRRRSRSPGPCETWSRTRSATARRRSRRRRRAPATGS